MVRLGFAIHPGVRMRRLGFLLLAVVVTSGCFRSTTTITVKQDGSGVIDQEIGASAGAMALLRNFSSGDQADKKASAEMQLFGPEQAQAAASSMGVRFVSGEPVKTAEVEGYRAHFAFDDVTKVKFSVNKTPPSPGGTPAEKPEDSPFAFGFAKGNGSSVLTINIPPPKPGEAGMLPKLPGGTGSQQDNAMAMAMILPMLRGLYVDVSLVVDGKIIKTNAPYVTGSQVTLVQFDFDKVSATDGALQKLQQITDPKLLKDIPGVRMPLDPVVTIEFGR
jgi:hypothetical protein